MFAIYNIQGRRFRDNLENLKRVHTPHSLNNVNLQRDVSKDETVIIQGIEDEPINKKGLDAYNAMIKVNDRTPIYHAYQLMTHPVITLPLTLSLDAAYEIIKNQPFNQMPVSNSQLQLVGMISLTNMLTFMDTVQNGFVPGTKVQDAMTENVITADPVTDIRRIANVMINYDVTSVPIVNEQDHLVGIITRSDLIKAMIKEPPLSLWT
ncbi:MAG: CBS domain-containing protein [Thiotrichales bacterium]|nr:CBS domain-containing protein [Thiotrichales bacterium]